MLLVALTKSVFKLIDPFAHVDIQEDRRKESSQEKEYDVCAVDCSSKIRGPTSENCAFLCELRDTKCSIPCSTDQEDNLPSPAA